MCQINVPNQLAASCLLVASSTKLSGAVLSDLNTFQRSLFTIDVFVGVRFVFHFSFWKFLHQLASIYGQPGSSSSTQLPYGKKMVTLLGRSILVSQRNQIVKKKNKNGGSLPVYFSKLPEKICFYYGRLTVFGQI